MTTNTGPSGKTSLQTGNVQHKKKELPLLALTQS